MSAEPTPGDASSDRTEIWTKAALEAERETGRHEETDLEAQASLLLRVARIGAGSAISILGLILIPLPGPGLVVLAAGLSILAIDVPFARRLLHKVRSRMPQGPDGCTSRWAILVMIGFGLVGLAGSASYLLG